mmetsp:Transcript_11097/g.12702  ORF Transcript_11097/g.12702 Transcript_11097/m.12702 type:complete len:172 (+) Transcript_11097:123-638(+)|eukprot:CAMPEP_0184021988 /NCGR_PEP_ID=MMETSP0954-20121128/10292_1 /TAXON_ID=627963 /ORGANISM="Aplanochytrium sp, Strain PBS07" /LENGTH=171 /DNA_ID=CAMNT_0026304185 /DNA_START=72 /DNA_END=587 /DNA_ORIENTATION=-
MENIPPSALKAFNALPESVQEKLQEFLFRAMQDQYKVPLATIPAAWALAYLPHFMKATFQVLYKKHRYNNETPREEKPEDYGSLGGVVARSKAAHHNALEMFPVFAIAVLTARIQKVKVPVLTKLCVQYLAYRLAYTFLYVFGINKLIAALRTGSWIMMVNTVMSIYGEAL